MLRRSSSRCLDASIGLCGIEIAGVLTGTLAGGLPQSDCVELKYRKELIDQAHGRASIGLCGIEICKRRRPAPSGSRPQSDCVELKWWMGKRG